MKKILLLGGSSQQVIAIKTAKELGYYTILCDYLSDNPGQFVADKFYLISTTDKQSILKVAKSEKINGILAYASDPAALTAAYVAEKLNLPSNPYKSVEILSNKHLFRSFLKTNFFCVPNSICFKDKDNQIKNKIEALCYPILVKPTDSSGSKGISKITSEKELKNAVSIAKEFSRNHIIQVEEYIEKDHDFIVGGDIFVLNEKVVFWGLLNCHRDFLVNPLVPVGKSYPLQLSKERITKIHLQTQKLIDLLQIKFGAFNIELLFDQNDDLYFIEMGPRNGGNMIPDLLSIISGKNMIAATIECAMGNYDIDITFNDSNCYYATYNLHTNKNGIYQGIYFHKEVDQYIIRKEIYINKGDQVYYFDGANKAVGIIFMKFNNLTTMNELLKNINGLIDIKVE